MTGKGSKAMLECKQYPAPEIRNYVGVRDNEGAKRKLNRYGVICFVNGRGDNANLPVFVLIGRIGNASAVQSGNHLIERRFVSQCHCFRTVHKPSPSFAASSLK